MFKGTLSTLRPVKFVFVLASVRVVYYIFLPRQMVLNEVAAVTTDVCLIRMSNDKSKQSNSC